MIEKNRQEISIKQWLDLSEGGLPIPIKMQVDGASMQPLIRHRQDIVTVLPLQQKPKKGDIVLFPSHYNEDIWVLHRVWKIKGEKIRTLGDGRKNPDIWMPAGKAVGVAVSIERDGKIIDPNSHYWHLWGRWRMWTRFPRKCITKLLEITVKHKVKVFLL